MSSNWTDLTHSHARALALARASFAAYGSKSDRQKWADDHGFGAIWTLEWGHLSGFVALHKQESASVVCFQGTNDLNDWGSNLDSRFAANRLFPNGRVHDGFSQAIENLWPQLEKATAHPPGAALWFTGHSLGGAMAMLAAARTPGPVAGLYTFGQPRVGDGGFADALNARLGGRAFRYRNANDPVPRTPPPPRYADAGNAFILSDKGLLDMAENLVETAAKIGIGLLPSLMKGDRKQAIRSAFESAIRDGKSEHNMAIYIERIARLAV